MLKKKQEAEIELKFAEGLHDVGIVKEMRKNASMVETRTKKAIERYDSRIRTMSSIRSDP